MAHSRAVSEKPRCPDCLTKKVPRPAYGRYSDPDGRLRCFNHSRSPEALARHAEKGAAGKAEAKARKAARIAGPKKGKGVPAAAAEPRPAPPHVSSTGTRSVPPIDFATADTVTATMERIVTALFEAEGFTPDTVKAAQSYCETAQKIRAPRGGPGKDAKPVRKIISFEVVPGAEEPPEPTAH